MWLQIDQSLIDHRKTRKVADLLDIPRVYVAGHMLALWLWCIDNAKDGNLAGISNRMLAEVAHWTGDPNQFVNALIAANFIDNNIDGYAIHNWHKYTGKLMEQRKAHARRQATYERKRFDQQIALGLDDSPETTGDSQGDTPLTSPCPSPDGHMTVTCPSTEEKRREHDTREQNRSIGSQSEPPSAPPLREDQAIWGALQRGLRIPKGTKFPDQTRFAWNAAIKEFRAIGVKADQIESLCDAYEAQFGKRPPTPRALLVHTPECQAWLASPQSVSRPNGGTRIQHNAGGRQGSAGSAYYTAERFAGSEYFRNDDPAEQGGTAGVQSTGESRRDAKAGMRGLEDLDGIPRSG